MPLRSARAGLASPSAVSSLPSHYLLSAVVLCRGAWQQGVPALILATSPGILVAVDACKQLAHQGLHQCCPWHRGMTPCEPASCAKLACSPRSAPSAADGNGAAPPCRPASHAGLVSDPQGAATPPARPLQPALSQLHCSLSAEGGPPCSPTVATVWAGCQLCLPKAKRWSTPQTVPLGCFRQPNCETHQLCYVWASAVCRQAAMLMSGSISQAFRLESQWCSCLWCSWPSIQVLASPSAGGSLRHVRCWSLL